MLPHFSRYGQASTAASPVNRMMAAFAADFRDDVDINLGVGYVNERTIPRDLIEQALHAVLAQPQKYRAALNYGGPAGSANLRAAIRRFHVERGVGGLTDEILDRNEILVGPNGATSILEALGQLLAPGIVVTTDPMYYIYCDYLERLGFEILAVPEDERGIDVRRLQSELDRLGQRRREIRFLYIVTVSNPTCTILANSRRSELVELAVRLSRESGRQVPLVLDKAYEGLIHAKGIEPPRSMLLEDPHGVVYEVGTLSKIFAPALRIGYVMGRPGPLLTALVQKTSDAGFSAPLVNQEIAAHLLDHHVAGQIERVNAGYREKAARTAAWLDRDLAGVIAERRGGRAGFYYYLTLDGIQTHEQSPFFRFLSRTTGDDAIDRRGEPQRSGPSDRQPRVIYVPGEFCVHRHGAMVEAGRRQLRISYGFEELPRIEEAIAHLRAAAEYARGK